MPSISVVIPVYNYADKLPRALATVVPQLTASDEVVLVNDGSTDDSGRVIADWASRHPESIRAVHQPNAGPGAARNHGARLASKEYVLFLDADDRLASAALANLRNDLARRGPCPIILGGYRSVQEAGGEKIRKAPALGAAPLDNMRRYLRKSFGTPHGAVLLSREVTEHLSYPEDLRVNEDLCYFTQALALYPARALDAALVEVHHHGASLRHDLKAQKAATEISADRVFDPDCLPAAAMAYKREFAARRWLSLSRALYLNREYTACRAAFHRAVGLWPRSLLQGAYLKKYLRSWLKR